MIGRHRFISRIAGALLLCALASMAHAQGLATGNISGRVTDEATGKSLPGVTVTVSGPALQGEQTEFTDSNGHFIITELPPGEYIVRFYYSNVKVERPGVNVSADRTLSVNSVMPTAKAQTQTFRITERAPTRLSSCSAILKVSPVRDRSSTRRTCLSARSFVGGTTTRVTPPRLARRIGKYSWLSMNASVVPTIAPPRAIPTIASKRPSGSPSFPPSAWTSSASLRQSSPNSVQLISQRGASAAMGASCQSENIRVKAQQRKHQNKTSEPEPEPESEPVR